MISQAAIYEYLQNKPSKEVILCAGDDEAKRIEDVAKVLGIALFALPDIRVIRGEDLRPYLSERALFLEKLEAFYEAKKSGKPSYLAIPLKTAMLPFPKEEYFDTLTLAFGDEIEIEPLKQKLYRRGYNFVDLVVQSGEISFRGDIIDIYVRGSDKPVRLSLFDTQIESIHAFDPSTQKRVDKELEEVVIKPAFLALSQEEYEALERRCQTSCYEAFVKDIDALGWWHLEELGYLIHERFDMIMARDLGEELQAIFEEDDPLVARKHFFVPIIDAPKSFRDLEPVDPIKLTRAHKDKTITIVARNRSMVQGSMLPIVEKEYRYIYSDAIVNLLGKEELILSLNKPQKSKRIKKPTLKLDELSVGDHVVHEVHGIGIFKGIEKKEILGSVSEYVTIEYSGGDLLQIPVSNLEVIDRYIAPGGTLPGVDKLGKASFRNLKEKTRQKLFAIAAKLIELSAKRHLAKGIKIEPPNELAAFSADAGFEHTPDQLRAIEAILSDLESGVLMDRIVSADVGFGKTEVAMHAIFAVTKAGYQSMLIVPTTLLSAQHYRTLKARFANRGVRVAKLDRFSSASEKRAIKKEYEAGMIDVVVGTHALLNLKPKKLALVVIDEEHKFGVKQKEKLKEMALQVHLLSMSATPIPRTLNMALSQIKSFSEILTPPSKKMPVRTFVKNYDPKLIKEAILRALRGGGQIFYVYNSIAGIERKKQELLELLPKLNIATLHSKIDDKIIEEAMLKFEAGEYDLLLSTSIVESGLHLPNANTMIVDGADRFGIADLHQLRGRVGRGGKEGYCYFFVEDRDKITDDAKRRLLALESHSELGSGATLAFYDLEIRGGGNLIGEAQSGHIKQIGYSLYLRMLENALRVLSGKEEEQERSVEMALQIAAYINEELVDNERLRLELYRRFSHATSVGEIYEIASEIEDRFGKLDEITRHYIQMMALKALAKEKGIKKISSYGDKVFVEFIDEGRERAVVAANSKDDDDILAATKDFLHSL